jgi:hypothetical protein
MREEAVGVGAAGAAGALRAAGAVAAGTDAHALNANIAIAETRTFMGATMPFESSRRNACQRPMSTL